MIVFETLGMTAGEPPDQSPLTPGPLPQGERGEEGEGITPVVSL